MTAKQRSWILPALFIGLILFTWTQVSRAQFQGARGGNPPGAQPVPQPVSTEPPPLETDLVLLTVSVTGPENRPLPPVARDRFQIFEDGVEQKISYFWEDSRPISIGFLIDESDWMTANHKLDDVRDTVPTFLKSKNPADEYFVIQFNSFPRMTVSYTTDAKLAPINFRAMNDADETLPDTALNDAIYLGLESIKESANARKALLVITAGGDKGCDGSKLTMRIEPLLAFAMKQPVQIYTMMIADDWGTANGGSPCDQIPKDTSNLEELASNTGGRDFIASNSEGGVNSIASEVARALKTQYLIGYKSTNTATDGKRRGVKVKVNSPEGSPKLKVWTRSGYYSAKIKTPKPTN